MPNSDKNYKEADLGTSSLNKLDDLEIPSNNDLSADSLPKWINNEGEEVKEVFGFNSNAELVNGRAAMFGFIMLILTELVFGSEPVTRALFGIG